MKTIVKTLGAVASRTAAISTGLAALPDPGMQIEMERTALVVTDPQNDFLNPNGATWGVVGKNVEATQSDCSRPTIQPDEAPMDRIEIYSTAHYPWCSRAKALLRDRGFDFEEIDIASDQAHTLEMIARSGRRTVPQIFIDDEPIGGYDKLSRMALPDRPRSP